MRLASFKSSSSKRAGFRPGGSRAVLKDLLPPLVTRLYGKLRPRIRFRGPYSNWEEAEREATGYAPESIARRVRDAARQVLTGEAAYERDSILFYEPKPPFPVLTGLLRAAVSSGTHLSVLDFGGSLGSTYFQCRPFLAGLVTLRWSVVEQETFVRMGKEFESDELVFYRRIEECFERERPMVALLSGVLQYLEKPYEIIEEIRRHRPRVVIIDRTPFCVADRSFISMQVVPSSIYAASYPFRTFRVSELPRMFGHDYRAICEFPAVDGEMQILGEAVQFMGALFEQQESKP